MKNIFFLAILSFILVKGFSQLQHFNSPETLIPKSFATKDKKQYSFEVDAVINSFGKPIISERDEKCLRQNGIATSLFSYAIDFSPVGSTDTFYIPSKDTAFGKMLHKISEGEKVKLKCRVINKCGIKNIKESDTSLKFIFIEKVLEVKRFE